MWTDRPANTFNCFVRDHNRSVAEFSKLYSLPDNQYYLSQRPLQL